MAQQAARATASCDVWRPLQQCFHSSVVCCYLQHKHFHSFYIIQLLTPPESAIKHVFRMCHVFLCKSLQRICQTRSRVMLKSLLWCHRRFCSHFHPHRWCTNTEKSCDHINSKRSVNLWSSVSCFFIIFWFLQGFWINSTPLYRSFF